MPGVFALVCLSLFSPQVLPGILAFDNDPIPPSRVMVEGEELVYNVRYGFIDLGQVRIMAGPTTRSEGTTVYRGDAVIQSYKGVPFVDLHAIYASSFDSLGFSHHFLGRSREDTEWSFSEYFFDYPQRRVIMETGSRDSVVERRDTLTLETEYQDGLSLFFFAREKLFSGKRMSIPTLVKEKKGKTLINFTNQRSAVESDFIEYPVDVIGFEGTAEFVGIFGLTGDFEGWFSNDEARVPVKANMKVIIGSVTIELVSWKREGWAPPRAQEEE
jgi:hypothetical protein